MYSYFHGLFGWWMLKIAHVVVFAIFASHIKTIQFRLFPKLAMIKSFSGLRTDFVRIVCGLMWCCSGMQTISYGQNLVICSDGGFKISFCNEIVQFKNDFPDFLTNGANHDISKTRLQRFAYL